MKLPDKIKDWAIDTAMKRAIIKKLDEIENEQINSGKRKNGIRRMITKSRLSPYRVPTTKLTRTNPRSGDRTSKHSRLKPLAGGPSAR